MFYEGCIVQHKYPQFAQSSCTYEDLEAVASLYGYPIIPIPDLPLEAHTTGQKIEYNASLTGFDRDYCIAEELGHIFLGHSAGDQTIDPNFSAHSIALMRDLMEGEATYFAACAFFPEIQIRSELRKYLRDFPQAPRSDLAKALSEKLYTDAIARYPQDEHNVSLQQLTKLRIEGYLLQRELRCFTKPQIPS